MRPSPGCRAQIRGDHLEYVAPATLDEAFRALELDEARCLAGGQSLVAMMNLGLVAPARLVSLRRIEALRGVATHGDGSLRIGAMTTHAQLAALDHPSPAARLLAQAARVVAYPAVRAWGTLGGSVVHADPAADYPVVLVAAQAAIEIRSLRGTRRVAAREFFRGLFETALARGEIVTAIHLPAAPSGAACRYEKLSLVAGDFAILSVAALGDEVAVGGYAAKPLRMNEIGETEPMSDHRASATYRRRVLPELVRRCTSR
jgi:carbon-monoxide dehydrogenase medium subunit